MEYGKRVNEIVKAKGIKGKYVEQQLNRPKDWFTRIVTGRQTVQVKDIAELSELLNVPVTDFFMPIRYTKSDKEKKGA